MFETDLTIAGLQEVQDANLKAIAALKPSGAIGSALRHVLTEVHRYSASITHVDTGALRASHRIAIEESEGSVYVDPTVRNPRSGKLVRDYARTEEGRGGSHAFYQRTASEIGGRVLGQGTSIIIKALP